MKDRLLPGRRHEVGHLRGRQAGLTPVPIGERGPSRRRAAGCGSRSRAHACRSPGSRPFRRSARSAAGWSRPCPVAGPDRRQPGPGGVRLPAGAGPDARRVLVVRGGVLVHLDPDRRLPDVPRRATAPGVRRSSGPGRRCSWASSPWRSASPSWRRGIRSRAGSTSGRGAPGARAVGWMAGWVYLCRLGDHAGGGGAGAPGDAAADRAVVPVRRRPGDQGRRRPERRAARLRPDRGDDGDQRRSGVRSWRGSTTWA